MNKVELNMQQIEEIDAKTKNIAKDMTTTNQSEESEFGSTAKGGKKISEVHKLIDKSDVKTSVVKTTMEMDTKVNSNNELVIRSVGDLKIRDGVTIDQSIAVRLVAEAIVKNALQTALTSASEFITESNDTILQKTVGKGMKFIPTGDAVLSGMGGSMWAAIIVIVVILLIMMIL